MNITRHSLTVAARAVAVLACLLTAGCVDSTWVRDGATPQMRERQVTACEAQALKDLPPDNVVSHRDVRETGKLKAKDGKVTSDRSSYDQVSDANRWQRETLVRDCMYRAGWSRQSADGGR